MRLFVFPALLLSLAAMTCAPPPQPAPPVVPISASPGAPAKEAITAVLDDWHDAAAHADEERYFSHLTEDAVFLGTDASERWDTAAFRAYAHPHFAKKKAWSFKSTRRDITVDPGGAIAWFDEDLDTPNLGPSRGSGVLVRRGTAWKISQYNLAVTVPNDRMDAVKRAAAGVAPASTACPASGTGVRGIVTLRGKPPQMKVPIKRNDVDYCRPHPIVHNAVVVKDGRLADVLVRIENGGVKGSFAVPARPAVVHQLDCNYLPRVLGAMIGQELTFVNDDGTLHNLHVYKNTETWFNQALPKGSPPIVKELEDPGIVKLLSDIFPWMRGFVVVTDHPFFAVTAADGAFQLDGVPPGKYKLEAWHSMYGLTRSAVEVLAGKTVEVNFEYSGAEAPPAENKEELKGLF